MSKINTKSELVSICTTFFNAGKYIHHFLESATHQTYKNIEIILVDDASSDNSQEVILSYLKKDPRIKYIRKTERTGVTEGIMSSIETAQGKFVIYVGGDDWLAHKYIENGLSIIHNNPEIAGVIPRIITLGTSDNNHFVFLDDLTIPSGIYKSEWLIRRLYKSPLGVAAMQTLLRKEDMISFLKYFHTNIIQNYSIPNEMHNMCMTQAFATDNLIMVEILSRYKKFSFDNSLVFIKIKHSDNMSYPAIRPDSASQIIKYYYYMSLIYKIPYKHFWTNTYKKMRIWLAIEAISTLCITTINHPLKAHFWDTEKNKQYLNDYLKKFSIFEILIIILVSPIRILYRSISFILRNLKLAVFPNKSNPKDIFNKENFLDSNGQFSI